jgi:hypothetical protein
MESDTKKKVRSEEYERFEELTRKLISVPKKDVEKEEKKFKKSQEKKRRV